MISLKSRLFRTLVAVLVPIWLLLAFGAYWLAMIEVDEIYEQQLRELAIPLLPLSTAQIKTALSRRADPGHPGDADDEMAVLIWDRAGVPLYRSEGAPAVASPRGGKAGDADAWRTLTWRGARWLAYWYEQPEHDRRLMVLRPLTERDELAVALAMGLALPSLLAVVLMVPLGAWAIRKGLQPLQDVGKQVASRRGHDLSIVDDTHVALELLPLVQEINGLLGRLDKALDAEKRFTADASHELRTPLAAVRAHIEVAMGTGDDEASRKLALERALMGLSQASGLTEQLLLLARLDHHVAASEGPASIDEVPGRVPCQDLGALVHDLAAKYGMAALEKGVDLSLEMPGEPCFVSAQPAWLGVAVGNVLSNAIKFTPASGRVDVRLAHHAGMVDIIVRDTGPGLAPGHMALVGQRFFRGRHDLEGAGLGLSIAVRIMALHGGELRFDSDDGLTVTLALPEASPASSPSA